MYCSVILGRLYVSFSDVIIEDRRLVDKGVRSILTRLQLDFWCLGIVNLIHLDYFGLVLLERRQFTCNFLFAILKWFDLTIFIGCESFL